MIGNAKYLKIDPNRREAIVNAALKEFAAQGYEKASTNVIAREAGISKPLLFHYVNSKKDLFLYLCDYCLAAVKKQVEKFLQSIKTERDIFNRLRQIVRARIEMYKDIPHIYNFTRVAFLTKSEQLGDQLAGKTEEYNRIGLNENEMFLTGIDRSRFKEGVDVKRALRIIAWAGEGFAREIHKELTKKKGLPGRSFNSNKYLTEFDAYLAVLKKSFYR